MNIAYIQYLLDTATSHSIHKTAEKYNISPQGASKAIKLLETELGVILLERSTRGVFLTKTGEQMLPYFEEILQNYEKLKMISNEVNLIPAPDTMNGVIRLAVTPRFSDTYLGNVILRFNEVYPKIRLHAVSMNNNEIFERIQSENNVFDIAIVNLLNLELSLTDLREYLSNTDLQFVSCYTSELYMCGTKKNMKRIGEKFYIDETTVCPVVAYNYGRIINKRPIKCDFMIDSIAAQLELINNHDMVGTYSLEEFKLHFNRKRHAYVPFDKPLMLTYGYLLKNNHKMTEAEKIFIQFLLDYFENK